MWTGGAGDGTIDFLVSGRPVLPPEPQLLWVSHALLATHALNFLLPACVRLYKLVPPPV